MAGAATLTTKLDVTGLGDDVSLSDIVTLTVPVAQQGGYTVLKTAGTTALQLFDLIDHIALDKIFMAYITAVVGTVYIKLNTAGTTTFLAAAADIVLPLGTPVPIPINPAGNLGVTIDGDGVTAAIKWHILGKA